MHPEAAPYVARATYLPFVSGAILASQWHFLRRSPRRYLGTFRAMLGGTWRSPNFLLGGIGIFPKVAHAARLMERDGVDHVHCHFATHPALAGWIVHRLVGIPYSFTAHGSDLHVDRTMLCQKVAEAAFTVTISDDNRAVFERECGGPIDTLEVIHCGVDTSVFHPIPRVADRRGSARDPVDRHAPRGQGPDPSRRGLPPPERRGRRRSAAGSSGEGPDRPALDRQVAAAGLTDRVEFLGRRTRAEVASPDRHERRARRAERPDQRRQARGHPGRAHGGDERRAPGRRQRAVGDPRARRRRHRPG